METLLLITLVYQTDAFSSKSHQHKYVVPLSSASTMTSSRNERNTGTILFMTNQQIDRQRFFEAIQKMTYLIPLTLTSADQKAVAFEGGVGGLGKNKPLTGVVFANPETVYLASSISTPGDYNAELLAPDGITPAFLSFYAPWPMMKSSGIDSRDLANPESAFVQVAPAPENENSFSIEKIPKSFFVDSIFGKAGKYGMYGTPTDIRISKVRDGEKDDLNNQISSIYSATFTTLTPAMRESDRKVYISTTIVGNGVFMLVTGTTASRFKNQDALLKKVAQSFICVEAPKSNLRR